MKNSSTAIQHGTHTHDGTIANILEPKGYDKKRKRKRKKKILTKFGLHVALVVAVFIRIATRFPSTLTVDTRTRIHRVVLKINLLLEIVKRTIEK